MSKRKKPLPATRIFPTPKSSPEQQPVPDVPSVLPTPPTLLNLVNGQGPGQGTNGNHPPVDSNLQLFQIIANDVIQSRNRFMSELLGKRKDIDAECDYPDSSGAIDPDVYDLLYEREPIPRRVVKVLPEESWQVMPEVYETEDGEVDSTFEKAVTALPDKMQEGESYHEDSNLSIIWNTLKEGDIESRKGHYGAIYLGLDDTADPSQPAVYNPNQNLVWLIALSEKYCRIDTVEDNLTSPRFGLPKTYSVMFAQSEGAYFTGSSSVNVSTQSVKVHWTRIVHISEGRVYHTPAMKPVLNRLLDLRKLYAGSAEMYWRGAFPGISFETDPGLVGEVSVDFTAARNSIEQYFNGLQRYFSLNGMTAKSLPTQVVDPRPQIEVQINAVCIELGIPKRVFMGSERGELASNQDDAAWNDRLRERQNSYLTSRIVAPFFNRLISLGILPKPPQGFKVYWPDLTSQTDEQKSSVALKLMQSLAQYLSSGGDQVITPYDFLTTVWKLSDKEAKNIIDRAKKQMEELGGSAFLNPSAPTSSQVPPVPSKQNGTPNNASQMPNGTPNPNKPANSTISVGGGK